MPRYVSYISKDRYTFAAIEQFPDDCRWAPWADWSSCANTCGNRDAAGLTGEGEQTRTREIATEAVNDGTPCNQTETCTVSVPAEVFSLKCEAQSCKKECQGKCLRSEYLSYPIMYISYSLVDCAWQTWDAWSDCSDSCSARDGTGVRTRSRVLERQGVNGGTECMEQTEEEQPCADECPGNLSMKLYNNSTDINFLSGLSVGSMDSMDKLHRILCCKGWVR